MRCQRPVSTACGLGAGLESLLSGCWRARLGVGSSGGNRNQSSRTVPACSSGAGRAGRNQKCRLETSTVKDEVSCLQMKLVAQFARVAVVGTLVVYLIQSSALSPRKERVDHTLRRPPSRPCSHPSTNTESAILYSAVYAGRG